VLTLGLPDKLRTHVAFLWGLSIMLRRFFNSDNPTDNSLEIINTLLGMASFPERIRFVLEHLCETLAGDVRAFSVALRGGSRTIDASVGYNTNLKDLSVKGIGQDSTARIITQVNDLFSQCSNETWQVLTRSEILEAKSTLLTGVEQDYAYGLLLFQRFDGKFTEADLALVSQWATLLARAHDLHLASAKAQQSLIEFSKAFMEAIESQDFKQLGHSERVTTYALALGRAKELSRQDMLDLYFAAMLHDVGKLGSGLDLSIEDPNHPQRGANMLAASDLLEPSREAIRAHHEHWDGTGFPNKLAHEQIPLLARMIAVADTFDFLSSERGQALTLNEVEKALTLRASRQLDPELVTLFKSILREGKSTRVLAGLNENDLF
jgi:HD-GYP domain-containing protein (c-di-GMP phosphodiesterase class II)